MHAWLICLTASSRMLQRSKVTALLAHRGLLSIQAVSIPSHRMLRVLTHPVGLPVDAVRRGPCRATLNARGPCHQEIKYLNLQRLFQNQTVLFHLPEPERQHLRASSAGAPAYVSISTRCTTAATAVAPSCAPTARSGARAMMSTAITARSAAGARDPPGTAAAAQPDRKCTGGGKEREAQVGTT